MTGDQQPSTTNLQLLALNAKIGDGHLWKHPECVNRKGVWTSTTPELLEVKRALCPRVFTTGVKPLPQRKEGRFPNAKPMYRLASTVHPVFTSTHALPLEEALSGLTLRDIGLWYLDDGSCTQTGPASYQVLLCVGETCATPALMDAFSSALRRLFGPKPGCIGKNGSKASERNKRWTLTKDTARAVLTEARSYQVLERKFPGPGWW
jgi:hypothetical protein